MSRDDELCARDKEILQMMFDKVMSDRNIIKSLDSMGANTIRLANTITKLAIIDNIKLMSEAEKKELHCKQGKEIK